MNLENEKIEPGTKLELALDYSSQCIQRISRDDPSAGANAGSNVCMTFVAANPLSELVWSPHRGLSLKCADCSFKESEHSVIWGAGPSNIIPETTRVNMSSDDYSEKIRTGHNLINRAVSDVKSEDSSRKVVALSPCTRAVSMFASEKIDTMVVAKADAGTYGLHGNLDIGDSRCGEVEDNTSLFGQTTEPLTGQVSGIGDYPHIEVSRGDPATGEHDVGMNNKHLEMRNIMASEVLPVNKCGASHIQGFSPSRENEKQTVSLGEESKKTGNPNLPFLEKLESTAENDLRPLNSVNIYHEIVKVVESESSSEVESVSVQDGGVQCRSKVGRNHSSSNSRIQNFSKKGKEKALSDGDANERLLKEGEDSHESVESCNSAGLFSVGRKRMSLEKQLIVGSKRAKHMQSHGASTSFSGQDSSFMNWISNMMKGLSKPDKDAAGSLTLAVASPKSRYADLDQSCVPGGNILEANCGTMGFKSIFQSIYCPNKNVQELKTNKISSQEREGSTEVELVNKVFATNANPIACAWENDNSDKQLPLSYKKFNESTPADGPAHPRFAASQENCQEPYSGKDTNLSHTAGGTNKCSVNSSNSTSGEANLMKAGNNNFSPSEEKMVNAGCKGDPLESLWISHFSLRTSCFPMKADVCRQSAGGNVENSGNCMRMTAQSQQTFGCHKDATTLEVNASTCEEPSRGVGKELQDCDAGTEASLGFRKLQSSHDQNMNEVKIWPFERLRNSEAVASMFARRLDALKHIILSNPMDDDARPTAACLFCGSKGHHLRNCSEVGDVELEDVLRTVNSYQTVEESTPLCIRCYQLNHWAANCPNITSKSIQREGFTYVVDQNFSNTRRFQNKQMFQKSDPAGSPNGNQKSEKVSSLDNEVQNSDWVKNGIILSPGQILENDNGITPLGSFVKRCSSDAPRAIFDTIKMLRLSRADILRWMNSHKSLVHLDGFFLRLRLAKWEEGLGGTDYHVACITGMRREVKPGKSPISVKIGGVKCLVESQYISNHDFLEDELMAWWCAASRDGGTIPSEEYLRTKVEEKKRLGF